MAAEKHEKLIIQAGDQSSGDSNQSRVDILDALVTHFSDGEAAVSDLDPKVVQKLRDELNQGDFFGEDMKHLWLMLEKAVAKSNRNSGSEQSQIRLLNLACGYCEEASILSAFFGKSGITVRQFAMDLRDHEIDRAKRRYSATESLFRKAGIPGISEQDECNSVEFVADDATKLVGYGQVPDQYDVIFIRHQNLWHDRLVWKKIYEFALSHLEPVNGVLIITSYFDREHLLALDLIKKLGGKVVFSEANPNTRELSYPGKSIDRHVAAIVQESAGLVI